MCQIDGLEGTKNLTIIVFGDNEPLKAEIGVSRKCFSLLTSYPGEIDKNYESHRVCFVKTRQNKYLMTSKSQVENLSSGQGHMLT